MEENVFFVDSLGNVWETCNADDHDACAFGPRGCARQLPTHLYNYYQQYDTEAGFTLVELG